MASDITLVVTAHEHPATLEQFYSVSILSPDAATVAVMYYDRDDDVTDTVAKSLSPYGETSAVPTVLEIPATFYVRKSADIDFTRTMRIVVEDAQGSTVTSSCF
jgi:hypothetical protein